MINNLSICVVTKNNEDHINDCIESIKDLSRDIIFIDLGSRDNTLNIISKYKIYPKISESICDNKNNLIKLSKNDWVFFIEPNEFILNGKKEIEKLTENKENNYSVLLLQNNIFSKSIRLFNKNNKLVFENPIHENIYANSYKTGIVLKQIKEISPENEYKIILDWKNRERLKSQPIYYECCYYIKNKQYDKFISTAEKYFFLEKNLDLPSYIMIKYYLSLIYFYNKKDFKNSIQNLIFCLEKNPTIAEFWCLLGDINFELKNYKKSYYFYDNALIFGKCRSNDDDLPIEINKYKDYPIKMKNICKEKIVQT